MADEAKKEPEFKPTKEHLGLDTDVDPNKVVSSEDSATIIQQHHLDEVKLNLDRIKEETEGMDETDGPADNLNGDASEDPADHFLSPDPFKKAFPPGPDDISKLV